MSTTATLAAPVKTYEKTSKEAHNDNVEFAKQNNLPYVAINGNTFPCKGVLFAFGGNWDKEAKCWMVPSHKAEEAKAIVAKFDKPAKTDKPAPEAKPVQKTAPVIAPKVETAPKEPKVIATPASIIKAIGKLLEAATDKEAQVNLTVARMAMEKLLPKQEAKAA